MTAEVPAPELVAPPALQIEGLTKQYGTALALVDVSLTLDAGVIYGLTGPNGGGKSTLLRIAATLERPTAGSIRVHDRDPVLDPVAVRQIVGYAGPAVGTANLTVAEELGFAARLAGLGRAERQEAVAVMLQLVDLHDRRNRPVGALSRGDLRRLAIARALVRDPLVVLLDGPFDGLDAAARAELRAVLAELAQLGKTLLLTGSLVELNGLCDAVGVLDHGRLVLSGPPGTILEGGASGRPLRLVVAGDVDAAQEALIGQPFVREVVPIDASTVLVRFDGDAYDQAALLSVLVGAGVQVVQMAQAVEEVEADLARLVRAGS